MIRRLLLVCVLFSSTVVVALGCCGAARSTRDPAALPSMTTATTAATTTVTTVSTGIPTVEHCGPQSNAPACGQGQSCCTGGIGGSYYCASLQQGAMCPQLP
jgi:hypothetical protein